MRNWDARAIIVAMLAGAVALLSVIAIAGLVIWGRSLTEVGGEVMIAILGAIVAIIAGYVGQHQRPPKDDDDAFP